MDVAVLESFAVSWVSRPLLEKGRMIHQIMGGWITKQAGENSFLEVSQLAALGQVSLASHLYPEPQHTPPSNWPLSARP